MRWNEDTSMERRFENAKGEALKQIENGLIQGAVFTVNGGPVIPLGNSA